MASKRSGRGHALLLLPGLLLVGALLLLPLLWLLALSFYDNGLSLAHYARLFEDPSYVKSFLLTFQIAGAVTLAAVLLGYPLCYWMLGLAPAWQRMALICVLIPFWTSLLVQDLRMARAPAAARSRQHDLQDLGVLDEPLALMYNATGTTIGMAHIMLPFLVLPLFASMQRIDRDLLKAGGRAGRVARLRVLARVLPALAAWADGRCAARVRALDRLLHHAAASRRRLDRHDRATHPAQHRAVQLVGRRKRSIHSAAGDGYGGVPADEPLPVARPRVRSALSHGSLALPGTVLSRMLLTVIAGVAVLVFLVLPIFIVVPMSFSASRFLAFPPPAWSLRWYDEYFGSAEWMLATAVSLQTAAATCLLATPIGVAAAYAIHTEKTRAHRGRLSAADGAADDPPHRRGRGRFLPVRPHRPQQYADRD